MLGASLRSAAREGLERVLGENPQDAPRTMRIFNAVADQLGTTYDPEELETAEAQELIGKIEADLDRIGMDEQTFAYLVHGVVELLGPDATAEDILQMIWAKLNEQAGIKKNG